MYDVAIIGSGAAGVSAAINLQILGKNFIWFGSRTVSKKTEQAELVKNYPGLPAVTGSQLAWTFLNHVESMGIKLTEEVVTGIYDTGGGFTLLAKDKQYEAKSVILCIGVEAAKTVEGEERFVGRGVSYCATCDGFLYKGKRIGIWCTDKRFEHEIEYLCSLAEFAYVMPLYKDFHIEAKNVKIVMQVPKKFEGGLKLNKIIFRDGEAEVDGMFILKGAISPSTLLHGLATEEGHVAVDKNMATNIAGVFAAGDCTGLPYQYAKAVGEGNVAAHAAVEYLAKNK